VKTVLITGATGYVGRRLTHRLRARNDLKLRLFARSPEKIRDIATGPRLEIQRGSTLEPESLREACRDIHTAYYLIHSMGAGKDYRRLDRISAENFRAACVEAGVKRIVYLGGLGTKETASHHLLSRIETGEILSAGTGAIQTIWFRAAVIIGSGSASFEIIRNLVQKLPVMTTPRWVHTLTQPIGIMDVLDYLVQGLDVSVSGNVMIDIGSEPMRFADMLLEAARAMGLKRLLVPIPFFSPGLSSYWLILMTPVDFRIARELVEGLKTETLVRNDLAVRLFPRLRPMPYARAVEQALKEIERDQVLILRSDRPGDAGCKVRGRTKVHGAILRDCFHRALGDTPSDKVFRALASPDGEHGWLRTVWAWRARSRIDRIFGVTGRKRTRRVTPKSRPGIAPPSWEVVDSRRNERLLLLSLMRLPGKAWLEFILRDRRLYLTAHFLPRGLTGRLYWLLMKPLHRLAFPATLKRIIAAARRTADSARNF
jgi:uncharacterized protein YbjT (DUF2867 family)